MARYGGSVPTTPLSGVQYAISSGPYSAVVASVGATLRSLRYEDRDLVVPFDADTVRPVYRGAVLAPWPNRVIAGKYSFDGTDYQLALTEPERLNALHGLVVWSAWKLVSHTDSSVALSTIIQPQVGYPFRIEVIATYSLSEFGLECSVSALNIGRTPAPYGTGPHPYLVAGPGRVDDWSFELHAGKVLEVEPTTLAPTKLAETPGGSFDFAGSPILGKLFVDHAFTDLSADDDGLAHALLRTSDGSGVAMSWPRAQCPWVQVHTADRPEPDMDRAGLAVEPMTCPPDAFNSGEDLVVLQRGATHTATWAISAL